MLQWFTGLDNRLFSFINENTQCSFLDTWMPVVTDFNNWLWLLIVGWIGLFIFGGKRGKIACIVLLVAVFTADNFTSYILKPLFGRLRPGVTPELVSALINQGAHVPSPSFPSGHSTNVFAMAMVLGWYYRRLTPIWFFIALLVGFSRIYMGVHYPLDILGGAVAGIVWALIVVWLAGKCEVWINSKSKKNIL